MGFERELPGFYAGMAQVASAALLLIIWGHLV